MYPCTHNQLYIPVMGHSNGAADSTHAQRHTSNRSCGIMWTMNLSHTGASQPSPSSDRQVTPRPLPPHRANERNAASCSYSDMGTRIDEKHSHRTKLPVSPLQAQQQGGNITEENDICCNCNDYHQPDIRLQKRNNILQTPHLVRYIISFVHDLIETQRLRSGRFRLSFHFHFHVRDFPTVSHTAGTSVCHGSTRWGQISVQLEVVRTPYCQRTCGSQCCRVCCHRRKDVHQLWKDGP
jgi:hypothetical protein